MNNKQILQMTKKENLHIQMKWNNMELNVKFLFILVIYYTSTIQQNVHSICGTFSYGHILNRIDDIIEDRIFTF